MTQFPPPQRRFLTTTVLAVLLAAVVCASVGLAQARRADVQDLSVVTVEELPREARETLALIKEGGPFPYKRDGILFGNRERRLPVQSSGHYREYTVPTPGARDRVPFWVFVGGLADAPYNLPRLDWAE